MVNNCCVCGCTNYVCKKPGLGFFCLTLLDKERNAKWTAAVRRVNWMPTKHTVAFLYALKHYRLDHCSLSLTNSITHEKTQYKSTTTHAIYMT